MVMVTPGSGHFTVNKHLLRLTTERILEHGICLDLINLTQIPLHSVPVFSFHSTPPIVKPEDARGKQNVNGADPLYYDDAQSTRDQQEKIYHCAFSPKLTTVLVLVS
jgi:DEP domain-containing protein 5